MKRLPSARKQDKQMAEIRQVRDQAWKTTLDARDQRDARRKDIKEK